MTARKRPAKLIAMVYQQDHGWKWVILHSSGKELARACTVYRRRSECLSDLKLITGFSPPPEILHFKNGLKAPMIYWPEERGEYKHHGTERDLAG